MWIVYVVIFFAALASFWAGWGGCLIANPALRGRHRRGRGDVWPGPAEVEQDGETAVIWP